MLSGLRSAARRLGLLLRPSEPGWDTPELELVGSLGAHAVVVRYLPGPSALESIVFVSPALDCGLDLKPLGHAPHFGRTSLRRLGRFDARADVSPTREPSERNAFEVHGDEEARVRVLLEPLRPLLSALLRAQVSFHVTDALVSIRRSCPEAPVDADTVVADVQHAQALAAALDACRASLSPAAGVANHVADFQALARNPPGGSIAAPLCAWGRLRGRNARALSVRKGLHTFMIESRLEWPVPLPSPCLELSCPAQRAAPRSFASKVFGRRQPDVTSFESVFGAPSDFVVPEGARAGLLQLHAMGHALELDGHGIRMCRSAEEDEIRLEESFDVAGEVLDAVERASRNRPAYR